MKLLLIDGYSLLYRDPALERGRQQDFRLARGQLIRRIDRLASALADRVELVFDGRDQGSREQVDTSVLHLIFSPAPQTADSVIEQKVAAASVPADLCVVTSDRAEIDVVSAAGAEVMSCAAFLDQLDRLEQTVARTLRAPAPRRFTLADRFPPGSAFPR